jgi:hypothetical protein
MNASPLPNSNVISGMISSSAATTTSDNKHTSETFRSAIRTNNILDDYEMKEEIAKGAYATCRRCVHKILRVEHAVKIVAKGSRYSWHDEVDILLRHSQHPHIVTLYSVSTYHTQDVIED